MDLSNATWRKSSLSAASDCVEVAFVDGQVALRNSKDQDGSVLVFTSTEWEAFIGGVQGGEFSLTRD